MADQDDYEQQRALLQAYRRSLALYLEQRAQHGTAYAPPALLHSINEAREHIQRIKAYLREHGIAVEDHLVDAELTREEPRPTPIRQLSRGLAIGAASLVAVLVLGLAVWWMLPGALGIAHPSPTAIASSPAIASPAAKPSSTAAASPTEATGPTASPASTSVIGANPQNWRSLARVTSAAFLDANTCWLVKELPATVRPDGDPAAIQAFLKDSQQARRVPSASATQVMTIPIQIANIIKDGEAIALDPKMAVTVHVQQPVPEHVDTITTCGGMGLGTFRNFSTVSLIQTANVEQYKLPITTAGDYFYVEPQRFEYFQVPLICGSPGIYTVEFELSYTYAGQPGTIAFSSPEIMCPKSYTIWLYGGEQRPLRRQAAYIWTGTAYVKAP